MIFKKSLFKVQIRKFEPHTDNDNTIARKTDLLNEIKKRIDPEKSKKNCYGKIISLKVVYYLNKNAEIRGQLEKDLDNMTKIVSDTITDYLTDQDKVNKQKTGLGLIHDDVDIHELHLVKDFVDTDDEQGLDIEIYKWKDKSNI